MSNEYGVTNKDVSKRDTYMKINDLNDKNSEVSNRIA